MSRSYCRLRSMERHRSRPRSTVLAPLLLFLFAAPALAQEVPETTEAESVSDQDDTTAQARALFEEGVELVAARDWAGAAAKFRAALELRDAAAVRYNLASALFEQGEYPEAQDLTESILADPDTPQSTREPTLALQRQLRARGGMLILSVRGEVHGAVVQLDGREVAAERLGTPIAMSADSHAATVVRDEAELARQEFQIARGETTTLELVVAPTPEEVASDSMQDSAQDPADDGDVDGAGAGVFGDWRFWAAVGGGVVVAAVVIVLVVSAGGGVEDPIGGDFEPGVLRW